MTSHQVCDALVKTCKNHCWVGIHFYEKQWEEQNHVSATSSSFRIMTIKTSPCVLTHLIQFLHISDDLSWVLHFQHCCPYHHSLLLVLHLSVMSTMLLHMSFIKDHIGDNSVLIPKVPFLTPFSWPPFLQGTWRYG